MCTVSLNINYSSQNLHKTGVGTYRVNFTLCIVLQNIIMHRGVFTILFKHYKMEHFAKIVNS